MMLDNNNDKAPRPARSSAHLHKAYLSNQISDLQAKTKALEINNKPIKTAFRPRDEEFPPLGAEAIPKAKRTTPSGGVVVENGLDDTKRGVWDIPKIGRVDDTDVESEEHVHEDHHGRGRDDQSDGEWAHRGGRGGSRGRGSGRGRYGRGSDRERDHGHGHAHGGHENGHRHQRHSGYLSGQDDSDHSDDDEEHEWRVVVVDTSALLWAPHGVRRLVKQGWEVIVPMEALRILDLLKTGSSPSARAARSATRYIEHSSRHHKPLFDAPNTGIYKPGRGLRIQNDRETRDPESVSSLPILSTDGEVLPKWMSNVLGCAAYFMTIASAESTLEGTGILYVANPPLSVEIREGPTGDIGQRGEGYSVSQEAVRFEIPIEVLRDDEDEVPEGESRGKGRNKSKGRGGGGGGGGGGGRRSGRGRGGRRGGGNNEESPEREVKILLRRPLSGTDDGHQPQAQSHGQLSPSIPAPQLSSPSTANRSPLMSSADPSHFDKSLPSPKPPGAPPPPPSGYPAPPGYGRPPPSFSRPPPPFGGPHEHFHRPPPPDGFRGGFGGRGRGHGEGPGPGPGRGRGGGRGRGRGGGGGGGGGGGDFVLLQRPGPPLATFAPGTAPPRPPPPSKDRERRDEKPNQPKVVLLQRPK